MFQKMHIIRDLAVVSSCISIGYKLNIFTSPILTKKSHWAQKFSYYFVRKNNFLKKWCAKFKRAHHFWRFIQIFCICKKLGVYCETPVRRRKISGKSVLSRRPLNCSAPTPTAKTGVKSPVWLVDVQPIPAQWFCMSNTIFTNSLKVA